MAITDRLILPSRLCVGPTDLTAAYPYGGTDLGLVRSVMVTCEAEPYEIVANEWGREVVDVVEGGEVWRISFALRGASVLALRQVFLTIDGLGKDGWSRMIYPSATRLPGRTRYQDAVSVLVVPLDPTNGPCTYFSQAIPRRAASLELPYVLREELTYAVSFVAARDETGRPAVFHGLLTDLAAILDALEPSGFGEDFGEAFGEGP